MSETKWTPGPHYVAESQTYAAEIRFRTVRGTEVTLARISTPQGRRDRAKANACLYASAPDLYRELEHLVMLMTPGEAELGIPGLATLNGARSALAKARGEER